MKLVRATAPLNIRFIHIFFLVSSSLGYKTIVRVLHNSLDVDVDMLMCVRMCKNTSDKQTRLSPITQILRQPIARIDILTLCTFYQKRL